jgi:hypothetical protein
MGRDALAVYLALANYPESLIEALRDLARPLGLLREPG